MKHLCQVGLAGRDKSRQLLPQRNVARTLCDQRSLRRRPRRLLANALLQSQHITSQSAVLTRNGWMADLPVMT